jgi:hypothetical protein
MKKPACAGFFYASSWRQATCARRIIAMVSSRRFIQTR